MPDEPLPPPDPSLWQLLAVSSAELLVGVVFITVGTFVLVFAVVSLVGARHRVDRILDDVFGPELPPQRDDDERDQ